MSLFLCQQESAAKCCVSAVIGSSLNGKNNKVGCPHLQSGEPAVASGPLPEALQKLAGTDRMEAGLLQKARYLATFPKPGLFGFQPRFKLLEPQCTRNRIDRTATAHLRSREGMLNGAPAASMEHFQRLKTEGLPRRAVWSMP